jgi:predicted exporter
MKQINFLVLFLLIAGGVLLKDKIHISTNLLSLFANKESIKKLDIANKLGYSKEMLIAVKGFDKRAKNKVREISKKLKNIQNIKYVQSTLIPTQDIQNYYKKEYTLLADFNSTKQTKEGIHRQFQALYNAQSTNIFYTAISKSDPLGLFKLHNTKQMSLSHRGDMISLGEYGYLIRVMTNVSPSNMNEAKTLYDKVQNVLTEYKNIVVFAPFFYTVENSTKIKADVQWILLLSTIVLLLVYYRLIKNMKLLVQTLVALSSSMIFAALICTTTFDNFNVLSLAFGMSLSAVSIDYLLHYHFHNFYETSNRIDKNVLYGFLTTISAFGIFSFIPIPIIAQISVFAFISLSFAYLLFTFIFPHLGIKKYVNVLQNKQVSSVANISSKTFLILSLLLFVYSAFNFKLDINIRNLDYQNLKLQSAEKLFKTKSSSKLLPVIVQGDSKEGLIHHLHLLSEKLPGTFSLASFILDKENCHQKRKELKKYDFRRLNGLINSEAPKIGFRKGYFKDAYSFSESISDCSLPNLKIFETFSLSTFHENGIYYSIALVKETKAAKSFAFVGDINVKKMFKNSAQEMYDNLVLFGSIVLLMILFFLFLSVKKRILFALNYILFPLSLTLAILVSFTEINMMHLFSLIILVAIGIDYGIYMSNSSKPANTMLAIQYSLLSTFAAFGVLVFSSIVALNSIGIVISLGCGAIFILIKVMK